MNNSGIQPRDLISVGCKTGNLELLKHLRNEQEDFESKFENSNEYPIHSAIMNKQEAVAIWLIREGLVNDSQVSYPDKLQPIHFSCKHLLFKVTHELLENGAKPNALTFRGYSPLMFACGHRPPGTPTYDQRLRIARFAFLLFAYGANPSLTDCFSKKTIRFFALTEGEDVTPYFKNAFKATAEPTEKLPLFPLDIWKMILRRISGEDLFVALRVCRTWHQCITQQFAENFIKDNDWIKL